MEIKEPGIITISRSGSMSQMTRKIGPSIATRNHTKRPKRMNINLRITPKSQVKGPPQGSKSVTRRFFIEKKLGTKDREAEYTLRQSRHAFP